MALEERPSPRPHRRMSRGLDRMSPWMMARVRGVYHLFSALFLPFVRA